MTAPMFQTAVPCPVFDLPADLYISLEQAIKQNKLYDGSVVQFNLPQGVIMFGDLVVIHSNYTDCPMRINIRVGGDTVFYGPQKSSLFKYSPEFGYIRFVD